MCLLAKAKLVKLCYMFLGVVTGMTIANLYYIKVPRFYHTKSTNSAVKYAQNDDVTKYTQINVRRKVESVGKATAKKRDLIVNPHLDDHHLHNDDTTIADTLYKKVRVLCWVMTMPNNLQTKAKHVKATWGKRCNKLLFMTSVKDVRFPTIGLNVPEGRGHLTAKTMQAFKYIYEHHYNDADWFLKADDDTYVILENLRYFLSDKDTNQPSFYGQKFLANVKNGYHSYHSGGAGYILGKEALRRFHKGQGRCQQDGGAEDIEMGKCMALLNVTVASALDSAGRSRFHLAEPHFHVLGLFPDWYRKIVEGARKDYLSDYAISFHYINSNSMYMLEYYVYHLRPYGIVSGQQQLN